ncbi:MAG: iron-containing redox enzyme family protein [Planctomycetes bacterium]|nr:iron-containing redox enzyme family protein [Planctomycetota bacterium]
MQGATAEAEPRALYWPLLHVDEHPHLLPVARGLAAAALAAAPVSAQDGPEVLGDHGGPDDLPARAEALAAWGVARREAAAAEVAARPAAWRVDALRQYAPCALLEGVWLERGADASRAHTPLGGHLLWLHGHAIGKGDPTRNAGNEYRGLLRALGVDLPPPGDRTFVEDPDLRAEAFALAALPLALAPSPRALLPEALGLSLLHFTAGPSPLALAAAPPGAWRERHTDEARRGPAAARALVALRQHLDDAGAAALAHWARAWRAARAWHAALERWAAALRARDEGDPRARMLALVRRKAPHGAGYHRQHTVGGRPIDAWFSARPVDAEGFLEALAASPLVVPGRPHESRLLALLAFGGPMFGVFDAAEQEVLRAWIAALPGGAADAPGPRPSARQPRSARQPAPPPPLLPARAPAAPARVGDRDLYHGLLNVEERPDLLPAADALVRRVLRRARRVRAAHLRPFPWSPAALDAWIDRRHRAQVEAYRPPTGPPLLDRADTVWVLTQMAPTVLVDGAWLQYAARATTAHTHVGAVLHVIYADEVGGGDPARNHPNLLRRLLADLGVSLPPFESPEFARWPGFVEGAFAPAAFWLAIGQHPRRYLPELLGLNLAIELTGLGATYMQAIDLLRHHGIDPYLIELHNTVDNPDTGHTALAAWAVKRHLEAVAALGGPDLVAHEWARVWTGLRTTAVTRRPLARDLALRLGPRVLWRWLGRRVRALVGGAA